MRRALLFCMLISCLGAPLLAQPPTANARRLQGRAVCNTVPTDTQVLAWDAANSCWKAGSVGAAGLNAVTGASALTEVNTVPLISAAGVLGLSKLKCPLGICTLYDDTAVTGDTVLQLRNGAAGAARIRFGTGGTYDAGFHRSAAGVTNVDDGTASGYAGLRVGTLTAVALTLPTITSVTPSANNAISCSYKLVAYAGDGTSTAASAAVATAVGPTNCNTMTVVWTAASNVTAYALERTGGPSNGMITEMAFPAWLNNATNCPGGTCTYIDLGVAASGAAPTANTTGQIVTKIATPAAAADACTAGAIWSDASYIYSCTSSGAIKRGAIAAW